MRRESAAIGRTWDELARSLREASTRAVIHRAVHPPLSPMACSRCGADARATHVLMGHAGVLVCLACAPLVAEESA